MDPKVWGPKLWFMIHTVALNYPNNPSYQDKRNHEDFFNNLVFTIPCDKCRVHYKQNLDKNPIINHLNNSDSLFRYTILQHNEVNKMLNKPVLSYEEVVKFYQKSYGQNTTTSKIFNTKTLLICLIVSVVISLGYFAYKKFPRRLIEIKKY
jgi:hypothetical protein